MQSATALAHAPPALLGAAALGAMPEATTLAAATSAAAATATAATATAAAAATATAATTSSLLQQPLPKGQRSQLFSPARHVRRDRRGTARSGEGAIRGYGI